MKYIFVYSRLRDGIELNAWSWENCAMYVQDLKLGINTTVDISKKEADNFKDMCRAFASATLHEQTIDEYLLKLSQIREASSKLSLNDMSRMEKSNYELSEASLDSLERFRDSIANLGKQTNNEAASCSSSSSVTNANVGAHSISNSVKKLEDTIKVDEILKSSKMEMNLILTRSSSRIQSEQEIIRLLSILLTTYDSTIAVVPFGSVTYGFGGNRTNFNILIITGCIKLTVQLINCVE